MAIIILPPYVQQVKNCIKRCFSTHTHIHTYIHTSIYVYIDIDIYIHTYIVMVCTFVNGIYNNRTYLLNKKILINFFSLVLCLYLANVNVAVDATTGGQTCFDYENRDESQLQRRLLSKRGIVYDSARILRKKSNSKKSSSNRQQGSNATCVYTMPSNRSLWTYDERKMYCNYYGNTEVSSTYDLNSSTHITTRKTRYIVAVIVGDTRNNNLCNCCENLKCIPANQCTVALAAVIIILIVIGSICGCCVCICSLYLGSIGKEKRAMVRQRTFGRFYGKNMVMVQQQPQMLMVQPGQQPVMMMQQQQQPVMVMQQQQQPVMVMQQQQQPVMVMQQQQQPVMVMQQQQMQHGMVNQQYGGANQQAHIKI
jgi:hypothetical protein